MNTINECISIDKVNNLQELRASVKRATLANRTSKSLDEKNLQQEVVFQNSANAHLDDWIKSSINEIRKSKSLDLR